MIQGTASNAGKSLLCAGLCRIFAQDGYRVAPFKSQNMALNSAITAAGLEMGRAQYVQALAAGVEPSVDMNPVLLKPTSSVGSQVIVCGVPRATMAAREYYRYKKALRPEIEAAYRRLSAENDIVVIEGAGSPAEINLRADDFVNMGMAKIAGAPVLLCGDIDRGGVFASLYGTVKLLEPEEQARIRGLIINKFRGDAAILRPGLTTLEELTDWYRRSGLPLKRLFNTSGLQYRALGLKDKLASMGEDEQLALLASDGMLVKRPILVTGTKVLPGFREADWQEAL